MNITEHLLTCLMEECAEVQKAASKALRFGLKDGYPGSGVTNAVKIAEEVTEVIAMIEMLQEYGIKQPLFPRKLKEEKKNRVREYMHYAKQVGQLEEN